MRTTKPPEHGTPLSIQPDKLDAIGLTEAYRSELDSLTRYLSTVDNQSVERFRERLSNTM